MPRLRTVSIAAVTAVLVGCVSGPAATVGNLVTPVLSKPAPCPDTPGFDCATLRVPLDHGGRVAGTLDLEVAMAGNADAPRGVLLVLSGGPGQPGVSLVNRIKTYLAPEVLQQYRLVMFDQRGTGPRGIDCADLQKAVGGSDFLTPPREEVVACANQLGQARDFYGSPDTVQDIEWLRRALGQPRIAVDGVSYGTFTAAGYALRHPGRVASLVLDSVVPHRGFDPFNVDGMAAARRVLKATCAKDPACTTDPVADLAWLIQHGEVDGPTIFESLAVLSLSNFNPTLRGIPDLLHKARNGDTAPLKQLMQNASSLGTPFQDLSAGLHMATVCKDLRFPWGTSATPLARRGPALADAVRRLDPAALYPFDKATARNILPIEGCLNWLPAKPSSYPKLQRLLPPTLILHGSNDLFCPVEWAHWSKRQTARGKLVVVPDGGHSVQGSRSNPTGKNEVKAFLLR